MIHAVRNKIFFLVAFFLIISSPVSGQKKFAISLSEKNSSLVDILDKIEEQIEISFAYSSSSIPIKEKISIEVYHLDLESTLNRLFINLPIKYQIKKNKVILQYVDLRQVVKGYILDTDSNEPIIGANVVVLDTKSLLGSTTDINGYFTIKNVPVGRQTIAVSSIGYEKKEISNVLVGSGKQVEFNASLSEEVIKMDEVVISSMPPGISVLNDMAVVSARSFGAEDTRRHAVGLGDPGRLALSFPGVTTTDDTGNEIIIRGNSPKGLLWRLEGVEIPSPNHFSSEGGSGGGISMFSTQVMSQSDFITGAFPAQYGNALSGVFDVNLRKGNANKRELTLQAGFLGLDFSAEGPFSKAKKSSFLFNYRYSTLAILDKLGVRVDDENESNVFQDLSFKMHFPNEKLGDISIFGLGGLSTFDEQAVGINISEEYDLGILGISHLKHIGKGGFISSKFVVSATHTNDRLRETGLLLDTATEVTNKKEFIEITDIEKYFYRVNSLYNQKVNAKTNIETGITYSWTRYDYQSLVDNEFLADSSIFRTFDPYTENNGTRSQQFYTSVKHRFSHRLSMVSGIHVLHVALGEEWSVEPRFGLSYLAGSANRITAGFGVHSRQEPLEYYFATDEENRSFQPNIELGLSKALHFVLGYQHFFSRSLSLKTELYYQHLYNIPINKEHGTFPISALSYDSGIDPDSVVQTYNEGLGRNYGIDIILEKQFTKNYYFIFNSSLYRSKYTGYDEIEYATTFDGRYNISFLAGKEIHLKTNKTIGINMKWLHNGNRRFTPVKSELVESNDGDAYRLIFDQSRINESSYKDYIRLDLQVVYRVNKQKNTQEIRLDIQNLLNRKNTLGQFWNSSTGEVGTVAMLPRIPVLSYRIEL